MRPCIEQFNDLAPLLPFRSWLDCTTNTSGYDFQKGQVTPAEGPNGEAYREEAAVDLLPTKMNFSGAEYLEQV
jgi:hypothetical protein